VLCAMLYCSVIGLLYIYIYTVRVRIVLDGEIQ